MISTDGDTYYMVMEYLIGETLQARLKRLNATGRQMTISEAIHYCAQICDAAGYAHGHELVHRDIKPANIMLDLHGQAILMDFGIVKIIGGEYHTSTGATVGTAMYMSPEQIRSERIDDRADIYSLGVTLYEMISGQPPYQADSAISLMMMVLNDPLPDLREIRPGVPEALLEVVARALRKERAERFQTMAEMAAALRQLNPAALRQLNSAALRQIDPGSASVASAPVKVVGQPLEADIAAMVPSPAASVVKDGLPKPIKAAASSIARPQMIPAEQERLRSTRNDEQAQPIEHASTPRKNIGRRAKPSVRVSPWRTILMAAGALILLAALAGAYLLISTRQPPDLQLSKISPSSAPLNAQTAQSVVSLGSWNIDSYVIDLEFSPDGGLLGTANNRDWLRFTDYRYYAGLWETGTARLSKYFLDQTQWVTSVAFSPDGSLFATASDDASIYVWQMPAGSLVRRIEAPMGGMTGVDFSPNNLLLAAGSWDGAVGLWQVDNGNLLRTLQAEETSIKDVKFSPDGSLLAAACDDGSILIWKVSDGSLAGTLLGHTAAVDRLAFSPDGNLLASAAEDHSIRTWQVSDGMLLSTLAGHTETVKDVGFSLDGSLLASGSEDGTVILWQIPEGQPLRTLPGEDSILSLAFSPDGTLLVSGAANGAIQFWGISEAIPIEMPAPTESP